MKRLKKRIVLLVVCCLLGSAAWSQTVIYVNAIAAGANNGTSWANAYKGLQDAMDAANPGDQLWVASGTYRSRKDMNGVISPSSRLNTFHFYKDLSIYGGFAGTETALSQRVCNPAAPTILTGDLGTPGDVSDNAFHVCYSEMLTSAFLLDCFTIAYGNGTNGIAHESGGGWYNNAQSGVSNPTFRQCKFLNNIGQDGGAFYNNGTNGGDASPTFIDCEFRSNASAYGGALCNDGSQSGLSSPVLTNCLFESNTAGNGGAIYNNGRFGTANGSFSNCSFTDNFAKIGAAVYQMADDGTTRCAYNNCTFTDNFANDYGGAAAATGVNGDAKTTYTNCIFEANHAVRLGGAVWNHGASQWFQSCVFHDNDANEGGAMYNDGENGLIANPRATSCEFKENTAVNRAGAMYNHAVLGDASPLVVLCKFIDNSATTGGAIYNDGSGNATAGQVQATYYNCLFSRNNCTGSGAVAYNVTDGGSCRPAFGSCSFAGNTAGLGSLFYLSQTNGGTCTVSSYNMASFGHTGTVGAMAGGATIQTYGGIYETGLGATCNGLCYPGVNPLFTNAATDDLTLQLTSPAINNGLNAWYLPQYPLDLAGNTRQQGGIIDLGAYETPIIPCPSIIYVNRIATGANNGTSWADAYRDLQSALAEARINPCTEKILIAKGTYKPTTVNDRNANFELVNDIEIYGGFPDFGNPTFADRDLVLYETILSGDIGVVGNPNDNSFVVVSGKGTVSGGAVSINLNAGTLLHGVSITQARFGLYIYANSNSFCALRVDSCNFYNGGNGIYIAVAAPPSAGANNITLSPTFKNCKLFNHVGASSAALVEQYVVGALTNPYFYKCEFFNNSSTGSAGAAYLRGEISPKLESCVFRNNTSTVNTPTAGGGAVMLEAAGLLNIAPITRNYSEFVNCLFHNNTGVKGGAVFAYTYGVQSGVPSLIQANLINCTFANNSSPRGSTLHSYVFSGRADIGIRNCVTWGNGTSVTGSVAHLNSVSGLQNQVTFTNSLIESPNCGNNQQLYEDITWSSVSNYACGPGNIFNQNPLFQNAGAADYRLSPGSPGFNTGNNGFVPSGITEDIAGNDRIHAGTGGIVDMGCYENYPGMALRPAANISTTTAVVYPGFGPTSATLTSSIIGGTAPYTYAWSNGATTADITVSPSQTTAYTLTVTDANGLSLLAARTITVKSILCVRPNGQIGVTICNAGGQTLCVSPLVATIMVAAGNATLGGCLEPNKTEQDSQDEQDLHDIAVAAGISIYPNPVVDVLHLQLDDFTYRRGVIIDPLGKVIQQWEGSLSTIHLPPLAAGIYYIRLEADGGTVSQRFVKQ